MITRFRGFLLLFFLFVIFFTISCKQTSKEILVQTDWIPLVDGKISNNEYTVSISTEKMNLYLSRNTEKLAFGLTGKTMGWIAIGFGAMGMDKAHIIMGYLADNTIALVEQTGRGHGHQPADRQICTDSVITETDGNNIFEGAVLVNEVIEKGQTELYVIIACGEGDDFTSRHIFRKNIIVKLE